MKFNQYETLIQAKRQLKSKGFKKDFNIAGNTMVCKQTEKKYSPNEMRIIEFHRFDEINNPADMSILFAVVCNDGEKGLITSSYGPQIDIKLSSFLDKVKIIPKGAQPLASF